MNIDIFNTLSNFPYQIPSPFIHPHQVATIDFLLKRIKEKRNVALYHLMGTGKTHTTCITATICSQMNMKVIIISTNETTKQMFEEILNKIFFWCPTIKTKNSVDIKTKDNIQRWLAQKDITLDYFDNTVVFIDEAHHWVDNKSSAILSELNEKPNHPIFILLSGSPLTNTVSSFVSFASILLREKLNKYEFIKKGKRVTDIEIKKAIFELVLQVKDQIAYYEQETKNVPPIHIHGKALILLPFVSIVMSDFQTKVYNLIAKNLENKMFKKDLLSQSFSITGSVTPDDIKMKRTKQIFSELSLVNGQFRGKELQHLNNSAKIKYFMNNFINVPGKSFVFFENATIGGQFILDVFAEHKITEFGQEPPNDFLCYNCGKAKQCEVCFPMKFIMINSYHTTKCDKNDINSLLAEFNLDINDDGQHVKILLASKMIAEACTLKEVRRTILLTIPSTFSELSQILTRSVRVFSHKDNTQLFDVFILVAIPNNWIAKRFVSEDILTSISDLENAYSTKTELISQYRQLLRFSDKIQEQESVSFLEDVDLFTLEQTITPETPTTDLPYDIEKLIFLEVKAGSINLVLTQLKTIPRYHGPIEEELKSVYVWEILKKVAYNKLEFRFDAVYEKIDKILDKKELKEHLENILLKHPIVISKLIGSCYLVKEVNGLRSVITPQLRKKLNDDSYPKNSTKKHIVPIGLIYDESFTFENKFKFLWDKDYRIRKNLNPQYKLKPEQLVIAKAINGFIKNTRKNRIPAYICLQAECGFGKTLIAINTIVHVEYNRCFVVTHNKTASKQFQLKLQQFLPEVESYVSENGASALLSMTTKKEFHPDVLIFPSKHLLNNEFLIYLHNHFKFGIVDEAHINNFDNEPALKTLFTRKLFPVMLSMTATPRIENILYLGHLIQADEKQMKFQKHAIAIITDRIVPNFYNTIHYRSYMKRKDPLQKFTAKLRCLSVDENRQNLITYFVKKHWTKSNARILILTRFTSEVDYYSQRLSNLGLVVFSRKGTEEANDSISEFIKDKKKYVVITTTLKVGTGFDIPSCNTVFMTSLENTKTNVQQYAGRCIRYYQEDNNAVRTFYYFLLAPDETLLINTFYHNMGKALKDVGWTVIEKYER